MNKKGFITITIVGLLVVGVLGYKFLGQAKGFTGDLQPAEDAVVTLEGALAEGRPVFLMFTGGYCPACVTAIPWVEELYEKYRQDVEFIIADVEGGGRTLAMQARIQTIPYFYYINSKGEVMADFAGYPSTGGKEYLAEQLQLILE